jgi:hypothetical protein
MIKFLIFCVVLLFFSGCYKRTKKEDENDIVFIKTPEYENKIKEFKISPEVAKTIMIKELLKQAGNKQQYIYLKKHRFIWKDFYVFSNYKRKTGIPLSGYHVNGKTGAIIKFESDKIIDVPDCIFTIKGEVMRIPKDKLTEPVSEK